MPRAAAKPRKPKKAPATMLPAGTLLMQIVIPERAVPWSAADVGRGHGYKDPRLEAWQAEVAMKTGVARRVRQPYEGPVEVNVVARFAKGPIPDTTNVMKGIEDAMQGVVYANDRQVIRNACERTQTGYDVVRISVRAAEPTED